MNFHYSVRAKNVGLKPIKLISSAIVVENHGASERFSIHREMYLEPRSTKRLERDIEWGSIASLGPDGEDDNAHEFWFRVRYENVDGGVSELTRRVAHLDHGEPVVEDDKASALI